MKKILFVHSSSELYGSDRSLLNIVTNLNRDKYQIHVLLPSKGPLYNEMLKIEDIDVQIFDVAVLRRKNLSIKGMLEYTSSFFNSLHFIKKFIKQNSIDIVDTNTAVVFPAAIAAKHCHKKSVWHIREIIVNSFENNVISFLMNKFADVIIANSKATGEALKVDKNKIKVVYNAVDNSKIKKIPHNDIHVGMAGRINRWKGQKLFVDAAEKVLPKHKNVEFYIAGEAYNGEEFLKGELQSYIDQKNLSKNVKLLGQVNKMSDFYNDLDIFVLPSIQPEPFGLVVIEAMSYGLPVIATKHGGPVEIIDNQVDGFLVDYLNSDEMANKIDLLISNDELREEMGKKGQIKKKQKFSIESMVNSIEMIFDEVMD